ncbi:hypothetical protein Tco_0469782 [Tanacetum coccineum]
MHESKSFNKHPANKTLYHALMESKIAYENAMDQGVVDLIKHKERLHDDDDRDQYPPAGRPRVEEKKRQAKMLIHPKSRNQLVLLRILHRLSQNRLNNPMLRLIPKQVWFRKPARPPTPDPEWNIRKSVDDGPRQN